MIEPFVRLTPTFMDDLVRKVREDMGYEPVSRISPKFREAPECPDLLEIIGWDLLSSSSRKQYP